MQEGDELKERIQTLFNTTKSFRSEVKLVEQEIWLTLNVGIINDNLATIVATDIFFFAFIYYGVIEVFFEL